jgi:ATP synthase protein I
MGEYIQLKRELYVITISITTVAFVAVAFAYELRIALSYLLGAIAGVVYLRLLAKDVDKIGSESTKLSPNRLALFVGLMLVAAKWHELQILPVFLGFLTYKAALMVYLIRTIWIESRAS